MKQVAGTGNAGFAMKVFGLPCVDPTAEKVEQQRLRLKKMGVKPKPESVTMTCPMTLVSLIESGGRVINESVVVNCREGCANEGDLAVMGDNPFSADSSVCRAAY